MPKKNGTESRDVWLGRGFYRMLGLDHRKADHHALALYALATMLSDTSIPAPPCGLPSDRPLRHWRRIWTRADHVADQRGRLTGPAIVLTAGGMCEGGPVQSYLLRLLRDLSTTVIFPGYCGSTTVRGQLLALKGLPNDERRRLEGGVVMALGSDKRSEIAATIDGLSGYSAHADQAGLLAWLRSAAPSQSVRPVGHTIFVSHGDPGPGRSMAEAIRALRCGDAVRVELLLAP